MQQPLHICNYCTQEGGQPLGKNSKGEAVCTLCGHKIGKYPEHIRAWQRNNPTPNNKMAVEPTEPEKSDTA